MPHLSAYKDRMLSALHILLLSTYHKRRCALLLLGSISFLFAEAQSESHIYKVKHDDEQVGEVRVSMTSQNDDIHYEVRSEISLSMLFKVCVSYKVQAHYRDGIMQASHAEVYLNGSMRSSVHAIRRNGYYDLVIDGNISRLEGEIHHSSSTLYFRKPPSGSNVFSETSGALKPLHGLRDGRMQLRNPQKASDLNTYSYDRNALLTRIEIDHPLFPSLTVNHSEELKH